MYKLYTDVDRNFTCKVDVGGVSLNECKARIILESKSVNLLFNGKINSDGTCTIPIGKLKNIFTESDSGNIKLEVIAENTIFDAWNDTFSIETKKKISISEIHDTATDMPKSKNISVSVDLDSDMKNEVRKNTTSHYTILKEQLKKRNVTTVQELTSIANKYFSIVENKGMGIQSVIKKQILNKLKKEIK
jgi:hypothetical protein